MTLLYLNKSHPERFDFKQCLICCIFDNFIVVIKNVIYHLGKALLSCSNIKYTYKNKYFLFEYKIVFYCHFLVNKEKRREDIQSNIPTKTKYFFYDSLFRVLR